MQWTGFFVMILLGGGIVFAGFVYDVLFAGIPYQDPTPALAAAYEYHARIASAIRWSGAGIVIASGLVIFLQFLSRKARK